MRTFHCNLDLVKSTERKFRWDEVVDGTNFELYIPKWRVPEPAPSMIYVKIYDASLINPEAPLGPNEKAVLLNAGWAAEQIREIQIWLPIRTTTTGQSESPIVAAVEFDRIHSETVRYRPLGDRDLWEIGEPYVPKSELGFPYPQRLILRIGWVY